MNVLDSYLQPLAFHCLTPLNNLWTWVALLTAALSYWKLRPSPASPKLQSPPPPSAEVSPSHVHQEPPHQSLIDGLTRVKFTAYYICDDTDSHNQCDSQEYWEAETSSSSSSSEWWESWNKLLRMRKGENESGWYVYQDLTELNGNVVRLWDAPAIHTSTSSILP